MGNTITKKTQACSSDLVKVNNVEEMLIWVSIPRKRGIHLLHLFSYRRSSCQLDVTVIPNRAIFPIGLVYFWCVTKTSDVHKDICIISTPDKYFIT